MNSLSCRCSAASLGYVRWHGYCCSAYLITERVFLGVWKIVKKPVNIMYKNSGFLPYIKFFKNKFFHNISFLQRYKNSLNSNSFYPFPLHNSRPS